MPLILIVDDDRHVRASLENLLASAGYGTRSFHSAEDLLSVTPLPEGNCAILDVRMKEMSGLDLQIALKGLDWRTPIIFLTAHCDDDTRARAVRGGAFAFLCKPFDEDELLECIEAAIAAGAARG